jgi:hypothetical protein
VPKFDPARQLSAMTVQIDKIKPVEAWQRWVEVYRPLAHNGFAVLEHPYKAIIEQQIAESKFLQKLLVITAAIIAAIGLAIALWPSSPARPAR